MEITPKFKIGDIVGVFREHSFLVCKVVAIATGHDHDPDNSGPKETRYGLLDGISGGKRIDQEGLLRFSGREEVWFLESHLFPDPRKMDALTLAQTLFRNEAHYKEWLGNYIGTAVENDENVIRAGDIVTLRGGGCSMIVGEISVDGVASCWCGHPTNPYDPPIGTNIPVRALVRKPKA